MARSDAVAGAAISGDGCLHAAAKATEAAATAAIRRIAGKPTDATSDARAATVALAKGLLERRAPAL
jgi:hypothetical protein